MEPRIPSALDILERVNPFQFLSAARRAALAERLELRRFQDGEVIVRRGENSRDVFLLAQGAVDSVDDARTPPLVLSTVTEGAYLGERASLFEVPRHVTIRSRGRSAAYSLPAKDFLALVDEVPVFAQALANLLKIKHGIFIAYRRLYARILGLIDQGEFLLSDLVPAYRALAPALHPLIGSDEIDVAALAYAVARLPQDVTETTFYFLTDDLPPLYAEPDSKFRKVLTKARRRSAWKPLPSKTIVLLRDGISDITDLLSCLCLYAVEARKLRHRIRSDRLLRQLRELSDHPDPERAHEVMDGLPLTPQERAGIERIWPNDYWVHLRNLIMHHEDIALEVNLQVDDYNARASEVWVSQIRRAVQALVDLEDPELDVHIISSNTHSVANCLSPYLARRRDEILAWGLAHLPELCGAPTAERPWGGHWRNPQDLLYVVARSWLDRVEGARAEWLEEERAAGHQRLEVTALTGIEVDLFDVSKAVAGLTDPDVPVGRLARRTLIVNVDYAFGQQAEEILSNLLFVFGERVRSVNVLGKAGGLVGNRGDLLLPNATLLQTNDELYPLPNADLPADLVARLAGDRAVHQGPVLTVAGTLLQDRTLLHFYRRIWKCVGLEMEGSFFARVLISAIEMHVVRPDVRSRFLYYTSDVPLNAGESLSEPLHPWEGVPPLYAITRSFLARIFEQARAAAKPAAAAARIEPHQAPAGPPAPADPRSSRPPAEAES